MVALNVADALQLKNTFAQLKKKMNEPLPILVEKMAHGGRELMVGMTRSSSFGSCVSFGIGGIFTEVFRDIVFRSAPLSKKEAQ